MIRFERDEAIGVFREGKQGVRQGYTLNACLELHTKNRQSKTLSSTAVRGKVIWLYVAFEVFIVFGCKCCRYNKELQAFISKTYGNPYYFSRITRKGRKFNTLASQKRNITFSLPFPSKLLPRHRSLPYWCIGWDSHGRLLLLHHQWAR